MNDLTIGIISRGRYHTLLGLLTSLYFQTFKKWDLAILEEYDTLYLQDHGIVSMLRFLKRENHKITMLHPKTFLGVTKSMCHLMRGVDSKYMLLLHDDFILEPNFIESLMHDAGAIGGMSPEMEEHLIEIDIIPEDINRWSGKSGRIWTNYQTLQYVLNPSIVEVDLLTSPMMFRIDLCRDWITDIEKSSYSTCGFNLEMDLCNHLKSLGEKILLNTGAIAWHSKSIAGGRRMQGQEVKLMENDRNVYYSRWSHIPFGRIKNE